MKALLILWAVGLAGCDKLDRTYLPPQGSASAGGYPEDLSLPLEHPVGNYPSTTKPESVRIVDSSLSSKYPNIALGIDRQGPFVSSPKSTATPSRFVSKNIYNIPPTISSIGLPGTSTILPVDSYGRTDGPVTASPQGYSFPSTSFRPQLNYDQYLIQQNMKENKASDTNPNFFSQDPVSNRQDAYPNPQLNPSSDNNNKFDVGQPPINVGIPEFQTQNIGPISTNLAPSNSLKNKYPTSQYGGDLDSISEGIDPSVNDSNFGKNYKQETFDTDSTPRYPINIDDKNENSRESSNSLTKGVLSTSIPDQTFGGKLVEITLSSAQYSPAPIFSDNFDARDFTNVQPQRKQADSDRNAVIINYENILTPEGFAYSFDTSNGIHADESGTAIDGVKAKGSYSFVGDDGIIYSVEYTADENGFVPRGDHLPTAPPIPDVILRGIEKSEQNKMMGIIDDGSYDDAKYGHQRYQGSMYQKPQNKYNDILDQPGLEENEQDDKNFTFGSKLPKYSANNSGNKDKSSESFEPSVITISPNVSKSSEDYQKNLDVPNNNEDSRTFNNADQPNRNRLFNSKLKNFNEAIAGPKNKMAEDIIDSFFTFNKKIDPNDAKIPDILNPIDNGNVAPKEYDEDYHSGYEYSQPQNKFNGKDQNNYNLNIPSLRNQESNLDAERQSDKIAAQDFVNLSKSYNVQKTSPVKTQPILRGSFNDPLTINNRGSNQIDKETNNDKVISTLEPKIASVNPYNYQSPYTPNGNGIQSNNYPSSTPGYSVSSTPSQIYSTTSSPTGSFSYSNTTPIPSQISSTLQPSIASGPSLRIDSRPGYPGTSSEQFEDLRKSTARPTNFGQRLIGRPGYQGRPDKIQAGLSGQPGFVGSTDPTSENLRASSRPTNFSKPPSMPKLLDEDFTGPKQPQKFDPEYGHYY